MMNAGILSLQAIADFAASTDFVLDGQHLERLRTRQHPCRTPEGHRKYPWRLSLPETAQDLLAETPATLLSFELRER
jgi:hypothetical protein